MWLSLRLDFLLSKVSVSVHYGGCVLEKFGSNVLAWVCAWSIVVCLGSGVGLIPVWPSSSNSTSGLDPTYTRESLNAPHVFLSEFQKLRGKIIFSLTF